MIQVTHLFVYPIKSLGGFSLHTAEIIKTGFKHDRRWMLVDDNNLFLSQRSHPQMALLQTAETATGIQVFNKKDGAHSINIPFSTDNNEVIKVKVWDDICEAIVVNNLCNEWFSDALQMNCKLVYMPDDTKRLVDKNYAGNNQITSFSDGYPLLMIGQSSLDNLNEKLLEPLPMNRFRPNIVFNGGHPHIEDEMAAFTINEIKLLGVKLCSRCVMTTINQQTALKGNEPLTTLATYRMKNNKIYFGQNVLQQQNGFISVGDEIKILKKASPFI